MNVISIITGLIVFLIAQSPAFSTDKPIASFDFNTGRGAFVRDTGKANYQAKIIGATWARVGQQAALRFDGVDDYVDVGAALNGKLKAGGTIVVAYRPEELVGGLVGWSSGAGWADQRCVLSYNTYGTPSLLAAVANGTEVLSSVIPSAVQPGQWSQLAITFDATGTRVYQDGIVSKNLGDRIAPDLGQLPLWIGRSQGFGKEYFKGVIESVHVYDHALSESDVIQLYKTAAVNKGKDLTAFEHVIANYTLLNEPGWIIGKVNYGGQRPVAEGAVVFAEIKDAGGTVLGSGESPVSNGQSEAGIKIVVGDLPQGNYTIVTGLRSPGSELLQGATEQSLQWPGRASAFQGVRALNNLVWELVNLTDLKIEAQHEITFTMPRKRWMYLAYDASEADAADLDVMLVTKDGPIGIVKPGSNEAMRELDAGTHKIIVSSRSPVTVRQLTIRSIPELIYSEFQSQPSISKFGPYDKEFLETYVLPNVNTLVCGRQSLSDPFIEEWNARGGKWLVHALVPGIEGIPGVHENPETKNVETTLKYLMESPGISDTRFGGVIADEFGDSAPHCALYAQALIDMQKTPAAGQKFYPYANALYTGEEGIRLVTAIMATGNAIAVKNYLPTNADEVRARQYMEDILIERTRKYNAIVPGSVNHLIMCLGYFTAPPEFLNVSPNVNYKTWLDMQFNAVANDPAFWGTYGLMTYLASYADDESVRWAAYLQRRYGMEGQTAPATDDPYLLPYMKNSDFTEGTIGWELMPAEEGSIRADRYADLGWLQGRYPRTKEGDTCLVMRRSAIKPNVVIQKIENLEPGKLYSFRMIASDFKDMSQKQLQAMNVTIDGVEMVPEKSFVELIGSTYTHEVGPYSYDYPAWMSYYWYIFRAEGTSATLRIEDWKTPSEAGGETGREMLINFAHVTPYFQAEKKGHKSVGLD